MVADVAYGSKYTLNFDVTTCGQPYTRSSAAWIDWNNDGVFDPDENIITTQDPDTISVEFSVPSNATATTTRLRIMVQEASTDNLDPCAIFAYGGVKDFSIQVGASAGLSDGWIFVIIVLVTATVYCGTGFYLNRNKEELSTIQKIPQYDFWKDIPGLTKEGFTFFIAKVKSMMNKGGSEDNGADYDQY